MILKCTDEELIALENLFVSGLTTDGSHHKQWYLERIARELGIEISDFEYEKGVAP